MSAEFLEDSLGRSVLRELHGLGSTPAEIAERLASYGFAGTRGSSEDDPLVHFLSYSFRSLPGRLQFFVSDLGVTVTDGSLWWMELPIPPQVSSFVRELDEGLHPDLEHDPGSVADDDFIREETEPRRPALRVVANR